MTEDLSLFKEIDEAIKAEKMENFLRRYGKLIIVAFVSIVVGTAIAEFWKSHTRENNIKETAAILQARELAGAGKYDEAIKKYEEVEQRGGYNTAIVAKMFHAETLLKSGKFDKATAAYNDIASQGKTDKALTDIAAINASVIAGNHNLAEPGAKLPAQWGKPFAAMASEVAALRLEQEGKYKEAAGMLEGIANNSDSLMPERNRAKALLATIKEKKQ